LKKIGIIVKADENADKKADELEKWLQSKRIEVIREKSEPPDRKLQSQPRSAPPDLSCVFVLGGDGTFLAAVRWVGDMNIPIVGVKFGEVGFLAETNEEKLFQVAEKILKNEYTTQQRMRLLIKIVRGKTEVVSETVLNDVVINKGALARLAHIKTYVDDTFLTTYNADGLIVSTPTGSTAYSLSAGGPIMHPAVQGIIITPICPFTLTNRPLIIPDTAAIKIQLGKKSSDMMITFDGQSGLEINEKDTIVIHKGSHPVNLITFPDQHYFDVLKAKLRWSGSHT
jgi:NAD+ kinase